MIRSVAKYLAWSRAPKATFAVTHPKETLRLLAARQEMRLVKKEMRLSKAPRIAAIGAAALALPIGVALGRITAGRSEPLA
jgi:hypothetical protein